MFPTPVRAKVAELAVLSAVLFTPLLFSLGTRDQFELPKLTFLSLLALFLLLIPTGRPATPGRDPILGALLLLFLAQAVSCLPSVSLNWRASLLGDYENFLGLSTSLVLLAWYLVLTRELTPPLLEKALLYNGWAALLSSLYAVAQRFGYDLAPWNPASVSAAREFASMGNPNFLAAYLAMSVPLYLAGPPGGAPSSRKGSPVLLLLLAAGILLLLSATFKFGGLLGIRPPAPARTCAIALGLLFTGVSLVRLSPRPSLPGLLLLLLGVFSTGSRGGFLALLAGLSLWAFLSRGSRDLKSFLPPLPKTLLWTGGTLAMAALGLFGRPFLGRLLDSIAHAGQSLETSRLHIWRPALKMIEAHPWFGTGLDSFKTAFPAYSGSEFGRIDGLFVSSRTAHNELLQAAATTGLVGLAAFLLLWAAFLFVAVRAWRQPSQDRRALAAILASAFAFQVQNLFSFGVVAINFLWILLLAALSLLARARTQPGTRPFPRSLAMGLGLLLTLPLFLLPVRRLAADLAFNLGNAASEMLKREPDEGKRRSLSDFSIVRNLRAAELLPLEAKYRLYLGLAFEQRVPMEEKEAKVWALRAMESYERTASMSRSNAYYRSNLGRIYTQMAEWDPTYREQAQEAYERAVELAPSNPLFLCQWALALERAEKGEEAVLALGKAFQVDADFTAKFLGQMAVTDYDQGDRVQAFRRLAAAIEGHPQGPEAYYVRGRLYLLEGRKRQAALDLLKVKTLAPTPEKNPAIQDLDLYLEEAQKN